MGRVTPYDRAWEQYHRYGPPGWSWAEVVGAHFRHGAVVSTDEVFILARRVNVEDSDWFHLSPLQSRASGNCWMVWCAAGRMDSLAVMARLHSCEWVSFQRRESMRVRRFRTSDLFRRYEFPESPQACASSCCSASGVCDGSGKGGCGSGSPASAEGEILV
jgi:hypothetical protein